MRGFISKGSNFCTKALKTFSNKMINFLQKDAWLKLYMRLQETKRGSIPSKLWKMFCIDPNVSGTVWVINFGGNCPKQVSHLLPDGA
jgi:hypothetical protein